MTQMPETPNGVIPYLTVSDAAGAIAFYEKAFGAVELYRQKHENSDKLMHVALTVNGCRLFLSDDFPEMTGASQTPETFGGTPVTLHMQVENVDETFVSAVEHGAQVLFPVTDMFWGDRFGKVRDPFGHEWSIASRVVAQADAEAVPPPKIA